MDTTSAMTKAELPTIREHDRLKNAYSPHASNDQGLVFDERCRRCWYEKGRTEVELADAAYTVLWESNNIAYEENRVGKQKMVKALAAYEAQEEHDGR